MDEQLIDRPTSPSTVAHMDIVSSLVGTVCRIARATVDSNGPPICVSDTLTTASFIVGSDSQCHILTALSSVCHM